MFFEEECKLCQKKFKSRKGLHAHIKKIHNYTQKKYYEFFFPKKSVLWSEKIKYKQYNEYFNAKFINVSEFIEWCHSEDKDLVAQYLIQVLKQRSLEKGIQYIPSEVELELLDYPPTKVFKKIFKSLDVLSKQTCLENFFNQEIPEGFFEDGYCESIPIFIDTREQKPIKFKNGKVLKLDFGDYTTSGNFYDKTYVDRKSEEDFKTTFSGKNYDRFLRELDRARHFRSYVFIVVESSIHKIKQNNPFCAHPATLPYIWHNIKNISQQYRDVCQFVFAENRSGLKKIIPKILYHGKDIWNVDLQFYLNLKIYEKRNSILGIRSID